MGARGLSDYIWIRTPSGVTAVADDIVWAVGISESISGIRPLSMHWDGQSWERVPTTPDADSLFNDVSASPMGWSGP